MLRHQLYNNYIFKAVYNIVSDTINCTADCQAFQTLYISPLVFMCNTWWSVRQLVIFLVSLYDILILVNDEISMAFRCVRGACPAYFLTCVFQLRLLLDVPCYALLVTVNLSCRRQGLKHLAVAVSALLPAPFGKVFLIISVKVTLVEDNSLVV